MPGADIDEALQSELVLARHFDLATITIGDATARADRAGETCLTIRPHHHVATRTVLAGVGGDLSAFHDGGLVSIGDCAFFTMPAAADPHFAARTGTTSVDRCMRQHTDALTRDDYPSAVSVETTRIQFAIDEGRAGLAFDADLAAAGATRTEHTLGTLADIGLRRQHDAPAGVARQRIGADGATILEGAGKDADSTLLGQQFAEIQHAVGRRLDLEGHIVDIETGQSHTLAGGENQLTLLDAQGASVLDAGRDEDDFAAARGFDIALVLDRAGRAGGIEGITAGNEIGVFDIECGGNQACRVDPCASAKRNAVGVDQKDFAVRHQAPEDGRGVAARDAVQDCAFTRLLDEAREFTALDGETLPIDDRAR